MCSPHWSDYHSNDWPPIEGGWTLWHYHIFVGEGNNGQTMQRLLAGTENIKILHWLHTRLAQFCKENSWIWWELLKYFLVEDKLKPKKWNTWLLITWRHMWCQDISMHSNDHGLSLHMGLTRERLIPGAEMGHLLNNFLKWHRHIPVNIKHNMMFVTLIASICLPLYALRHSLQELFNHDNVALEWIATWQLCTQG